MLLKYAGYSYQRPLKKDKAKTHIWLKDLKKVLKKLKEHQNSVILVADEARLEYDITTKPVWPKKVGKKGSATFFMFLCYNKHVCHG